MIKKVNQDYEWATTPSQRVLLYGMLKGTLEVKNNLESLQMSITSISSELNEAAPSLFRQAKGDVAVYEGLLQDKATKLKRIPKTSTVTEQC